MKNTILIAATVLFSTPLFANVICTINHMDGNPTGGVSNGIVSGVVEIDLTSKLGTNNFVIKKDGSLLKNVSYGDIVANPAKIGNVDGDNFISFSRDQGVTQGITVTIGTIHLQSKTPSFENEATSPVDEISLTYLAKAIDVRCSPQVR